MLRISIRQRASRKMDPTIAPRKITVLCGGTFGKRPYYLPDAPSKRPRRTKEDHDRPQTLMGGPQ
jgi:hypothetical protein